MFLDGHLKPNAEPIWKYTWYFSYAIYKNES